MIQNRATLFAGVLIASAVATSGCALLGGEESSSDDASGRLEKSMITVSVMPTIDLAPFHLAIRKGYFAAEGLQVQSVNAPSGQASLSKLIGGDADIAYSSYTPFFVAQSQRAADLRFVADASAAGPGTTMVVAMPGAPVKNVRDLAGKRIAVTGRNTISDTLVKSTMKNSGVDYGGVRWIEIPFPDTAAALARGDVDAAFLTEPFITQASRSVGAVPVVDTAAGPTKDLPTAGYGTLASFAKDNPRTVAAFQRAMRKATDEAADRAQVEPLIVEFAKVDPAVAAATKMLTLRSAIDVDELQRVPDLLVEYGIIKQPVGVAGMVP
jgi:NitT/TauT family transport system substrate-binding protein